MKTTRKTRPSSSSTSTVTYTFHSDTSKQPPTTNPHHPAPPTTVHLHHSSTTTSTATAAAKIQAAYRSHMTRKLVKKIASVKAEADRLEELIQQQETVDAVRSSEKEKARMNEALMRQLLELDSVPGFDPGVRELRRSVSRRIVGLQEILDGICGERVGMEGCDGWWRDWNWDSMVEEMEKDLCRERGGEEFERFCAHNLGFRCLQRFLREP